MTTDYLAGLAARALGIAPIVRPRPAARFESQRLEEHETASIAASPDLPRRPAPSPLTTTPPAEAEPAERADPAGPAAPASPVERDLGSLPIGDEANLAAPDGQPSPRAAAPRGMTVAPVPRAERAVAVVGTTAKRPSARAETPRREPPPVRVTIGRIEVRAVAQPPVPQRPAPHQPPPLSLDEYLELRRSGRR
jgi:hypothetical protein